MGIIYNEKAKTFTLHTQNTTYQMQIDAYGFLLHLYYGRKTDGVMDYLLTYADRGFSGNPHDTGNDRTYSLDVLPQEFPCRLTGDFRSPVLDLVNADGSFGCDLRYQGYEICDGKYNLKGLPAVYAAEEEAQTLIIYMKDQVTGLQVELLYGVLPEYDVITRSAKLINDGVLSQMDMGTLLDYCAIQLNGEKAGGKEAVININFTDTKEKVMLMLKNGVLNHRLGSQDKKADLTMEIAKMDFVKLFFGRTDLQTLRKTNKVKTTGDTKAIDMIRSAYEPADPNFKIVLP